MHKKIDDWILAPIDQFAAKTGRQLIPSDQRGDDVSNVYVRLCEPELRKILESLSQNQKLETENLACKLELLLSEMQPGTNLTLEALAREKGCKKAG